MLTLRQTEIPALEFYQITMSNILVTSFATRGSSGEDRLTENVSLNFSELRVTYQQSLPPGAGGSTTATTWNTRTGTNVPAVLRFPVTLLYTRGAPTATVS